MHVITGVGGFIGSNLAIRLLQEGNKVLGVDNFLLGTKENINELNSYQAFQFFEFDLTDREKLSNFLSLIPKDQRKKTLVWHLAANSDISAGIKDINVDYLNTFDTTVSLLEGMRDQDLDNIVFSSSSAIYGDRDGKPMAENEGPYLPISNYGAMKLSAEAVISAGCESFLSRATIFRFPNVVGERLTHGVVYDFAKKLKHDSGVLDVLGDGSQCKPYLYVNDLIDAMFLAHSCTKRNHIEIYNIAAQGDGTSVKEIAELMVKENQKKTLINYGKTDKGWIGDVSKVKYDIQKMKELGWSSKYSSLEAISIAIKWALKHV